MQISCVGGFGSNSQMVRINGTANINAVKAAAEQGKQLNIHRFLVLYGDERKLKLLSYLQKYIDKVFVACCSLAN